MGYLCQKLMPKKLFIALTRKISRAPDTSIISREQMKFYQDNGYLIIKQLFDIATLNICKNRFADICNGSRKNVTVIKETSLVTLNTPPEKYIYKIQDILHDELFRKYSENPMLLNLVSQFIGEDITVINPMLINKPPGSTEHPPHQDLYYLPCRPADKMIGVWTAMDPANRDNGCMFVIPGSHITKEIYKHKIYTDSKKFFHCLVEEEKLAPVEKRIISEINPGDTIFFHINLIHGSGPNYTKNCRKSMVCHFANSNCQIIDVEGSIHEEVALEYESAMKSKGITYLPYRDIFKLKIKSVRGAQGNMQL